MTSCGAHLRDIDDEVDLSVFDVFHHVGEGGAVERDSVAPRGPAVWRLHQGLGGNLGHTRYQQSIIIPVSVTESYNVSGI